jgi:hypothetical protein
MITDLTSITAILTLGIPVLILIMLLPAILELKKPKDIMDNISEVQIQIMRMSPVANIENEQRFDKSIIAPLAKIIEVLPNLEV